jgi:hypothetical protein
MLRPRRLLALSNGPADVEPREIRHGVGSHRQAEIDEGLVDLVRKSAVLEEEVRLPAIGVEHPVSDEPVETETRTATSSFFASWKTERWSPRRFAHASSFITLRG